MRGVDLKTVVHVLPYMAKGGTEKHVLTLCRGQRDRYRVVLLAPEGEILPEFLNLNILYVPFPEIRGNVIGKIRTFKQKLLSLNREYGVDLVHVHAAHEFVRFSNSVLPSVPIIFHLSAHQGPAISRCFNYWLSARISKKNADLLIAVSEEEMRLVTGRGFPPERVRVVYNGYEQTEGDDEDRISALREEYGLKGVAVIGNLGRLHRTKRLDVLIRAFKKISEEKGRKAKLLLIGDGPDRERLELLVNELGLEKDVHFPGFIPRGDKVLSLFDIFVLPTTFEGCSNVLVEAMARGLPIIATDVPSVAWMFEDGKSALLMDRDSVSDLFHKLQALLDDSTLRDELSRNALKRFASDFTAEGMLDKTDAVYRSLMGPTT
jgi:glycosyltransferase involved in cell wall biosynthesis